MQNKSKILVILVMLIGLSVKGQFQNLEFGFGVSYSDYYEFSSSPISQGIIKFGTDYRATKWLVLNTGLVYQRYANANSSNSYKLVSHNITVPAMVVLNYRHRFRFLVGTSFEYHLTSVSTTETKTKDNVDITKDINRDPHYTGALGAFLSFGAKWVIYQSDKIDINVSLIYNTMFNAKTYKFSTTINVPNSSFSNIVFINPTIINYNGPIMQTNMNFCIGVSYKLFKNEEQIYEY